MDKEWPREHYDPHPEFAIVSGGRGDESADRHEAMMDMLIRIDHKLNCIWEKMKSSPSDGG
jgi:hypothetical protein